MHLVLLSHFLMYLSRFFTFYAWDSQILKNHLALVTKISKYSQTFTWKGFILSLWIFFIRLQTASSSSLFLGWMCAVLFLLNSFFSFPRDGIVTVLWSSVFSRVLRARACVRNLDTREVCACAILSQFSHAYLRSRLKPWTKKIYIASSAVHVLLLRPT